MTALILLAVVLAVLSPCAYALRRRLAADRVAWARWEAARRRRAQVEPFARAAQRVADQLARIAHDIGAGMLPPLRRFSEQMRTLDANLAEQIGRTRLDAFYAAENTRQATRSR